MCNSRATNSNGMRVRQEIATAIVQRRAPAEFANMQSPAKRSLAQARQDDGRSKPVTQLGISRLLLIYPIWVSADCKYVSGERTTSCVVCASVAMLRHDKA